MIVVQAGVYHWSLVPLIKNKNGEMGSRIGRRLGRSGDERSLQRGFKKQLRGSREAFRVSHFDDRLSAFGTWPVSQCQ